MKRPARAFGTGDERQECLHCGRSPHSCRAAPAAALLRSTMRQQYCVELRGRAGTALAGTPSTVRSLLPHLRTANLLLIGPDGATREFLAPLIASLPSPVVYCNAADPEFPNGPVGSLIVRDVDRLTPTHQLLLLEWLSDRSRGARVIATSARQVFSDVTSGVFSDSLYYRLNTVTLLLNRRDRREWQDGPAPARLPREMPQADFVKK
jgi:sigma-54-interacting transcriptional regulator